MFLHLVYASAATPPPSTQDLLEILEISRRNNREAGITGLLLYSGGTYIQALEGPPEHVWQTFERIARDPRHHGTEVLLKEQKEQRYFPEWEMGFYDARDFDAQEVPGVSTLLRGGTLPSSFVTNPQRAHKLLLAFRSMAANDLPHNPQS
jgi:hypothetical protein